MTETLRRTDWRAWLRHEAGVATEQLIKALEEHEPYIDDGDEAKLKLSAGFSSDEARVPTPTNDLGRYIYLRVEHSVTKSQ